MRRLPAMVGAVTHWGIFDRHSFRRNSLQHPERLAGLESARMSSFQRLFAAVWRRLRALSAVITARRASWRRLQAASPKRILVVCYGNIYRSAFVGVFLRDRLGGESEIRSCGFHRVEGRCSPDRHIAVSREYGVDLDAHRSRLIQPSDLQWADVIVLMDRHNWAALTAMGAPAHKLVWLGALLPGPVEVSDPYELGDDEARRVVARMSALAEQLVRAVSGSRASGVA
jgi:protein-tyrosine-phosphatase